MAILSNGSAALLSEKKIIKREGGGGDWKEGKKLYFTTIPTKD